MNVPTRPEPAGILARCRHRTASCIFPTETAGRSLEQRGVALQRELALAVAVVVAPRAVFLEDRGDLRKFTHAAIDAAEKAGVVLAVPSYRMRFQLQVVHVVEQAARELQNDRAQLAAELSL